MNPPSLDLIDYLDAYQVGQEAENLVPDDWEFVIADLEYTPGPNDPPSVIRVYDRKAWKAIQPREKVECPTVEFQFPLPDGWDEEVYRNHYRLAAAIRDVLLDLHHQLLGEPGSEMLYEGCWIDGDVAPLQKVEDGALSYLSLEVRLVRRPSN